jgi:hypothetical protein
VRRTGLYILTLTLLGCATIPIQPVSPGDTELVEEAAADLGYGVDWTARGVRLELTERHPEHSGKTWMGGCDRNGESSRHRPSLRHEIGHLLGLPDLQPNEPDYDPANVMAQWVGADTTELTSAQREAMRIQAGVLRACQMRRKAKR